MDFRAVCKADFRAGGGSFITVGGSLINFKVCKNDQIRECHRPRIGVPKDSSLDINDQLTAFFREAGLTRRKGCTKRSEPQAPCLVYPVVSKVRPGRPGVRSEPAPSFG